MNKILCGDVIEQLKTLPDCSIQCCVTSPPYFGLRDYGTSKWEGGNNPDCDHKLPDGEFDPKNPGANAHVARFNREKCWKCGAKRIDSQIGLERTPTEYVAKLIDVFREVRRVLKKDGVFFLNIGDSYNNHKQSHKNDTGFQGKVGPMCGGIGTDVDGLKSKDLIGIPWRVAFALQSDGWWLRQNIIWAKGNPMPESVTDRFTKSYEDIFLLTKSSRYYFDNEAVKEPTVTKDKSIRNRDGTRLNNTPGRSKMGGLKNNDYDRRNRRNVWHINTKPYRGCHFAVFPEAIPEICIKAGSKEGDLVLDPFAGSGTTLAVAKRLGRQYVGCELNPKYIHLIQERLDNVVVQKILL
jgi:DNA modification methylase